MQGVLEGWSYSKENLHEVVSPPAGVDLPWLGGVGGCNMAKSKVFPQVGVDIHEGMEFVPIVDGVITFTCK